MKAPQSPQPPTPIAWDDIDLVVFDVDGTLYDQRRLRVSMLVQLLAHAWRSRSLDTILTLRTFRQVREALGSEPGVEFLRLQYARTAIFRKRKECEVRAVAEEWMERRPLERIAQCRFAHLQALFVALRSRGKTIAVFSDFPARAKLQALGLHADPVVCATDPEIGRLKPDPRGLNAILRQTGIPAQRALMIGDRFDRDAASARAAGVQTLIRARRPHPEYATFRSYDDPVFHALKPESGPDGRRRTGEPQMADKARGYLLVGGLAAVVDIGVFHLIAPGFDSTLAAAVTSFVLAAIFNYTLSSIWVYRQPWRSLRRAVLFALFASVGLSINAGATWLIASSFPVAPTAAKVAGVAIAFIANFLMNTFLVFRGADPVRERAGRAS